MKCYLKYNFQYLLVTIFWTIFAFYHLTSTGRISAVVGGLVAGVISMGWSLFRHHEMFGRR